MGAQYLIRFDDLCPTMNWQVWDRIERVLIDLDIRPILGVVPDNRDDILVVSPPRPDFWDRVRLWQSRGWTIGIHGFQHRSVTRESGLIGLNARSEFAGLPREEQQAKVDQGIAIFTQERVRPEVWLAPNCSFDGTTVAALRDAGIRVISDGLWLWPFQDDGMVWVPHQMWRFHWMPFGVWTVGIHHNGWTAEQFSGFQSDLGTYRDRIVDLPGVIGAYRGTKTNVLNRVAAHAFLAMIKAKRLAREVRVLKVPSDAY